MIGALGCRARPGGDILPHEQTMPKDKSDRLDLLAGLPGQPLPHLGPVAGAGADRRLRARGPAGRRGRRRRRRRHELWVLDRPRAIEDIRAAVAGARW